MRPRIALSGMGELFAKCLEPTKLASSPVKATRTMELSNGVCILDNASAMAISAAVPEALSSAPL